MSLKCSFFPISHNFNFLPKKFEQRLTFLNLNLSPTQISAKTVFLQKENGVIKSLARLRGDHDV